MQNAKDVANTIKSQIGAKALFMLGAKNLCFGATDSKAYLEFKISGSKHCNYIRILYDAGQDLYILQFLKIGKTSRKTTELADVYAEDMIDLIEKNTGLYARM